jgi:two-component system chemotaxis response regulator CheY
MSAGAELISVIVAEDNSSLRGILRSFLVDCGLQVLLAADGVEAVTFATSTAARMVILDVRMPNMDGLQACSHIRSLPGYAGVPIVMLSAHASESVRAAAKQAGATLFLAKPISNQTLKEGILPLLGSASAGQTASFEWKRHNEPVPAYGESTELAQGRKLLDIYRRGTLARRRSRGPD